MIHGMRNSVEYRIWWHIKGRIFNENDSAYVNYGGRGITMDAEWAKDFTSFYESVGPRPSAEHTLDRIDNSGNYEPGNVRWATRVQQSNNRRSNRFVEIDGVSKTIAEWCNTLAISQQTVSSRLRRGWQEYDAITIKVGATR